MWKVRPQLLLALLGSFLLVTPAPGVGRDERVPAVLSTLDDSFPAWVAAEKALTPSGALDPALFSETTRSIIAGYLATPPDGDCIRLQKVVEHQPRLRGPEKRGDLTSAIRNSDWVFLARVAARSGGFYTYEPGSLLVVEPVEIFKGPTRRTWEHYVFMPAGTFQVGSSKICKTDPAYADLPEVGEEILLLIDLTVRNRESDFLETGQETGIITFPSATEVSLPRRYREEAKKSGSISRTDLSRLVRQLTGSGD